MRRLLLAVLPLMIVCARDAEAHFRMLEPASWTTEDSLGDPQKSSPCGGEGGTPTGMVTRFTPGETITVRWQETIYHPGHFRIAVAANRADLIDPVVTVDQNQISVSATIDDPPVAPVLLDNLFPRTSGSGSGGMMFEQDVVLPNMECASCTLQLIQFMVGHGPPNYIYFHCANIEIIADVVDAGVVPDADVVVDAGVTTDAGTPPLDTGMPASDAMTPMDAGVVSNDDAGVVVNTDAGMIGNADAAIGASDARVGSSSRGVDGGCSCTAHDRGGAPASSVALLLVIAVLVWRRFRSHV